MTYFSAGLRVYDISNATQPVEIAYFEPDPPSSQAAIQFNDVIVDTDGLIYVGDRVSGGLYILELTASAEAFRPSSSMTA
jgi:hypothetical protein